MQRLISFSLGLIVVVLSVYILVVGKNIIIPFVVALVIGYFMITLVEAIQSWHIPKPLAYIAVLILLSVVSWVVLNMLIVNVTNLVQQAPVYQQKFIALSQRTLDFFHIKKPLDFSHYLEGIDFVSWGSSLLFMLTDFASSLGLILIYVLFILIEHSYFQSKIAHLFVEQKSREKTLKLIGNISSQIQRYVRIKTLISLLTAFLSYLVLAFVQVDFAVFWAFLIFVLNFIPTIGSIMATAFPAMMTLLQFESLVPFAIVTITIVSIQFFIGNFVDAKVMGKSFNLSALVILLSLAFWGEIWGLIGMFLCVPIMVIANIILANFEPTKPIAVLLSQDGDI